MRPLSLLTVAMMIVAWILPSAALAAGPFDGEWKVILTTKTGPCRFFDFPMTIQEGAMRGVAPGLKARYEIKGRVRRDGNFSWGWGHATGHLSENAGTGQWVTTVGSVAQNCSGEIALQREK